MAMPGQQTIWEHSKNFTKSKQVLDILESDTQGGNTPIWIPKDSRSGLSDVSRFN